MPGCDYFVSPLEVLEVPEVLDEDAPLEVLDSRAAGLDAVLDELLDSAGFDSDVLLGPLAEEVEPRESVMYQPLPLKTMPTGWSSLRSSPPHASQVVSGWSLKLWRFSVTLSQA